MKLIEYAIVNTYDEVIARYKTSELRAAQGYCRNLNEGISEKPYSVVGLYREDDNG